MAADFSEAGAQAARLALKMGSGAVDTVTFMAGLGEELPAIGPLLTTLTAIREKVETVKSNREELAALQERCTYITACFIVKCRRNSHSSEIDVAPIEGCVEAALKFVERCRQRGKVSRVLKASSDKDEIAALNARVDRLARDLGLAGIAVLEGRLQEVLMHLETTPPKQAAVPKGAPARKSWHVERRDVMDTVFRALAGDTGPRLVGLVGHSGSGKTTAASEIVRSTEVREVFSDGVLWLTVNDGARGRLSSLMLQLARMVYEDIGGSVGRAPGESDDGVAYVKQRMVGGHEGRPLKCLVVADNVWEKEVVSKLLETGMSVLLSTRDEGVVTDLDGEAVGVDELSAADAESVLRRAAELAPGARLPDDAVELVELCGRVAMDLAFLGRLSTVRGRQDRTAWAAVTDKVRAELGKLGGGGPDDVITDGVRRTSRRKAILRAGFEDLAIGSDDERVPRLYLSLAVLPTGYSFDANDAAVLLYDRTPGADDVASARGVVECLERWSVLRSPARVQETNLHLYAMHDAHSDFARESLMDRGDIRRPALKRWTTYLSSLDALRSMSHWALERYWLAVERVGGGSSWQPTNAYAKALREMADSDPLLWETSMILANLQQNEDDWEGASMTCRRMLQVGDAEFGQKDVAEESCSLRNLADNFREEGRLEEAEGLLRRCLGIIEAKKGPEYVGMTKPLYHLGKWVRDAGRLKEAEELLRRCLGIMEAKLPENAWVANVLFELEVCVRYAGRLEEAEGLSRRCLEIVEANLGPEDLRVAYPLLSLGVCLRKAGRLDEAEELFRRSTEIVEAKLGPDDGEQMADTLVVLDELVRGAGRLEEAEELLRRCLGGLEARLGPEDDVQVAYTLLLLGVCLRETGRFHEAEELLGRCLSIREAKLSPTDLLVADSWHHLGVLFRETGRVVEAENLLRRCLALQKAVGSVGHLHVTEYDTLRELRKLDLCAREGGRRVEAEEGCVLDATEYLAAAAEAFRVCRMVAWLRWYACLQASPLVCFGWCRRTARHQPRWPEITKSVMSSICERVFVLLSEDTHTKTFCDSN